MHTIISRMRRVQSTIPLKLKLMELMVNINSHTDSQYIDCASASYRLYMRKHPILEFFTDGDGLYKLCLLGKDSLGTQTTATEYFWTYDTVAPSIDDISILNADGYYKDGDKIVLQVNISENLDSISGSPLLELNSEGSFDSIGNASYEKSMDNKTIHFSYTVQSSDNAKKIGVEQLLLNGSTITDLAGNALDLTLPGSPTFDSSLVHIDNVGDLTIDASDFNDGDATNLSSTTITVTGTDIVGFEYKLTQDILLCDDPNGYTLNSNNFMNLDIASLPEGPNYFCAVGQISTGFVKDVENGVSTFSFTKDTTPPVYPVNLSGLINVTDQSTMQISITASDVVYYRYLLGKTASIDCSLEAQYSTEKEVASGDITLNFIEEGDHTFCLIAADELRNWQTTAQVTTDNILYDTGPPQLLDIRSTNQNRMHNTGEEIHISSILIKKYM